LTPSQYKLGSDFPREAFVQQAIEKHFESIGYRLCEATQADLICAHPQTKERWIVEAKGETTAIGLDFNTGLGQLLGRMDDPSAKYAMALPKTKKFIAQCDKISTRVRDALNLHWILVDSRGAINIVGPNDELPSADV
jgi:hypothetical protein